MIPLANNQSQDNDLWKLIWGLSIPNKVSNLLWRSCLNAIPAKRNLWRRKISPDVICEHCKMCSETVSHALWECSKLLNIWDSIPTFSFQQWCSFPSLREGMVMWTIWYWRNQLRISCKEFPLLQVIPQATQALADFLRTDPVSPARSSVHTSSWVRWSPPLEGSIKINFNGATFQDSGKAGLGVVIREC